MNLYLYESRQLNKTFYPIFGNFYTFDIQNLKRSKKENLLVVLLCLFCEYQI